MNRQDILSHGILVYDKLLGDFKTSGDTRYYICPLHEDTKPSLRVSENKGKYLWICPVCDRGGDPIDLARRIWGLHPKRDYPRTLKRLGDLLGETMPDKDNKWSKAQAVYDYTDHEGHPLYQKGRFVVSTGKTFLIRSFVNDEWVSGLKHEACLYNLPALAKAQPGDPCVIVEGEKDVETLKTHGILATTGGGAGTWKTSWNSWFQDLDILVIPDCDEPGQKHARRVAAEVASVAREVRVLNLQDLDWVPPKGGDITDYIHQTARTPGTELLEWWENSERIEKYDRTKELLASLDCEIEDTGSILSASDAEARFVWGRVLPVGGFSLVASSPGVGKSTLTRGLAVAVAQGRDFLGMETMSGPVVLFPLEEDRAEVRRHLRLLGLASGDRIVVAHPSDQSQGFTVLNHVVQSYTPVLVVIDPMQEFLGLRDLNNYSEVYERLKPVRELARNTGSHILFVHHTSKANAWILGSQAIKGALDSSFIYRIAEGGTRILECDKIRIGDPFESIAVRFDPVTKAAEYGGTARDAQDEALANKIAELVRLEGRALSRNEIHQATGAPIQDLWRVLSNNPGGLLRRQGGRTRVTYDLAVEEKEDDYVPF